jgi:molybdopterin-synthase adenylyltransferase
VKQDTLDLITRSAETLTGDDGTERLVINLITTTSISLSSGIRAKEVEIAALRQGIIPLRYLRNVGTVGLTGQIKMLESTVAVVGAGGLGGNIIELLARNGIGHIIIIDDDRFSEPDLNRQIMSTEADLDEPKAEVARKRAMTVNSSTDVTARQERLTPKNAATLLRGARVVADGLDNLQSRYAVEQACRDLEVPYVYGAIAGLGGHVMTVFPQDPGLSSIYGPADVASGRGIETAIGTPAVTPAIIAALQVQEVIKIITGVGTPVRNRILIIDASRGAIDAVELDKSTAWH